jgi:citronellol/citronellal dehydrogenase
MIVAVAAAYILTQNSRATTGNFFVDEEVLTETGITDFSGYAVSP